MNFDCPILVCGVGSVGERHIRNLELLGHRDIGVYRSLNHPYRTLHRHYPVFSDLNEALRQFKPGIAFITNPTALHVSTAINCAEAGCHLFIEKPVSHTLDHLEQLDQVLEEHQRFAMVGYMMRFHPLLSLVKTWLEEGPEGTLGEPVYVRACWGEHVPDWHPWEDYRASYATNLELGGGPALTLSHELDILVWMFGQPTRVLNLVNRSTPLQIQCEHGVDFLMSFDKGVVASVHLDYFQRPAHRAWELTGTRSRVVFDYYAGTLTRYNGSIGECPANGRLRVVLADVRGTPPGFDRNDMFIAELKYFFDCLAHNRRPSPGVSEAAESVRVAATIKDNEPSPEPEPAL